MSTWGQTAVLVAEVLSRGGDHTIAGVVRAVGPPVRIAAVAVILGALRELGLVEAHGGDGASVPTSWRWHAVDRALDLSDPLTPPPQEAVTRAVVRMLIRSRGGVFDARVIGDRIFGAAQGAADRRSSDRMRSAEVDRALDRLVRLGVVRVERVGADRRPHYGWARLAPASVSASEIDEEMVR